MLRFACGVAGIALCQAVKVDPNLSLAASMAYTLQKKQQVFKLAEHEGVLHRAKIILPLCAHDKPAQMALIKDFQNKGGTRDPWSWTDRLILLKQVDPKETPLLYDHLMNDQQLKGFAAFWEWNFSENVNTTYAEAEKACAKVVDDMDKKQASALYKVVLFIASGCMEQTYMNPDERKQMASSDTYRSLKRRIGQNVQGNARKWLDKLEAKKRSQNW